MASLTTRIGESAHKRLRQIAKTTGRPTQEILDRAISEYDRKLFWEDVDRASRNLRNNPNLWKAELKERSLWERTLGDGLDEEVSFIRCEDVRAVSKERLSKRLGKVAPPTLAAVENRLRLLLEL